MDSLPPVSKSADARSLLRAYWRRNLMLMSALLLVWAIAGLGCGILWADWLNQFQLFGTGYPLGFWFAQQGSIIVFVLLVLTYALTMNRIDRRYLRQLSDDSRGEPAAPRSEPATGGAR